MRGEEVAAEPDRLAEVVGGGARLELIEEPDPLLREGEREGPVSGDPLERGRRQEGGARGQRLDACRELRQDRRLEELPQGDLRTQSLPEAGDGLRREQGVAAQREEVVLGAHVIHAQDLPPHSGDRAFGDGPRRDERPGEPLSSFPEWGGRSGRFFRWEYAEGVEEDEGGGYHVSGGVFLWRRRAAVRVRGEGSVWRGGRRSAGRARSRRRRR